MSINFGSKHLFTDRSGSNQITLNAGVGESLKTESKIYIDNNNTDGTNSSLYSTGGGYFEGDVYANGIRLTNTISGTASSFVNLLVTNGTTTNAIITRGTITKALITDANCGTLTLTNTNASFSFSNYGNSIFYKKAIMGIAGEAVPLNDDYGYDLALSILGWAKSVSTTTTHPSLANTVGIYGSQIWGETAGTIVDKASTLYIGNAPYAANNITISSSYGLYVSSNAYIGGLVSDDIIVNNILITNSTSTTLSSTNAKIINSTINNLITTNATIGNLNITSSTMTNSYITNGTITGLLSTNTQITNGTITGLLSTNAQITNSTINNLITTNSTIGNLNITSSTVTNSSITNGTITGLSSTNAQITNGTITNLQTTNSTIGTLNISNSISGLNNLTVSDLIACSRLICTTNATIPKLRTNDALFNQFTSTVSTIEYLTTTDARITNGTITGLSSTNGQITNGTIANLTTDRIVVNHPSGYTNSTDKGTLLSINPSATFIGLENTRPALLATASITIGTISGYVVGPVSCITDRSASLYIEGPPWQGSYNTLTDNYSLLVDTGRSKFDSIIGTTGLITSCTSTGLASTTAKITNINITSGTATSMAMTTGTLENGGITNATITNELVTNSTQNSTLITTSLKTLCDVNITSTTASTSTNTGALLVAGGIGVGKQINGCQPYLILSSSGASSITTTSTYTVLKGIGGTPSYWKSPTAANGCTWDGTTGAFQVPTTGLYLITLYSLAYLSSTTLFEIGVGTSSSSYTGIIASSYVSIAADSDYMPISLSVPWVLSAGTNYYTFYRHTGTSFTLYAGDGIRFFIYKLI